jgi:hypothetical protein
MPQRELLGDHAPHREAQQVRSLDGERVHQRGDVICHVCDGVGGRSFRTAADVPVVEDHHLEPLGQRGHLRECPQRGVVPDPHDQYERWSLAVDFEVEFLPVRSDRAGP